MYRIAICDDSFEDIEFLKSILKAWEKEREQKVSISTFNSSENFLFNYAEDKSFDILLLDIEMGDMDGVSLAKALRKDGCDIEVAFITGYPDFISDGYEVNALHYLMKPVKKEKLISVLDKAAENLKKKDKHIIIPVDNENVKISLNKIQYIEVFSHKLLLVTEKGNYEVKMPLYEINKSLSGDFIKCHRSYIVNLSYVSKITKTEVILDSGKNLPLARNSAQEVLSTFVAYYKDR